MRQSDHPTILHLSDLHFGWDQDHLEHAERRLVLDGLLRALRRLDADWKPDCVCVTGDVGGKAQPTDYREAEDWLGQLLRVLAITTEALFVCAGNHDVDRHLATESARPSNGREADEVLRKIPPPEHCEKPFGAFVAFCRRFGIPSLTVATYKNWLIGGRSYRGVNFVCLNSAWFSKDDEDKEKLWLGQPQLKLMEDCGQLPSLDTLHRPGSPVTVVLMHHPDEYLHESERWQAGGRLSTTDYLAMRSHALLTGHTHGEPKRADRKAQAAWHFRSGAAYAGAEHTNSFRIIRVEPDRLVYRCFEYKAGSPDFLWTDAFEASILPYKIVDESGASRTQKQQAHLAVLREKAAAHARLLVDSKSRAIRPSGPLPRIVPLNVSARDKAAPPQFTTGRALAGDTKQCAEVPLYEAAKQSRKTLLLGDLGTGKSTAAGLFAIVTQDQNQASLAFVARASQLVPESPLTTKGLLRALSRYFQEQVCPGEETAELEGLLRQGIELTLIVDGLDELSPSGAADLLNQSASLTTHWPNVQVVATARPVELMGVNYADWQVVKAVRVRGEQRIQLLEGEAIADGLTEDAARERAQELNRRLRSFPLLDQVADSPLAIRLLYARLSGPGLGDLTTVGDLLFDIMKERLELWARRNGKAIRLDAFQSHFHDAQSRLSLLGELALELVTRGRMTKEQAISWTHALLRDRGCPNPSQLADEALEYFHHSGILSGGEELQFVLQPFLEFACGYGLAVKCQSASTDEALRLERHHWRSMSFAAAVIRRLGWTQQTRARVSDYLTMLLSDRNGIPAAGYVISELRDEEVAGEFVSLLKRLGPRPLTYARDERGPSGWATAEALRLARQAGFDWLFEEYLDPRYPIINTGSGVIDEVFDRWIRASIDTLTDYEKARLRSMILPHVEGESMQLISLVPLLSLAVPDAFDLKQRLWFSSRYLGDDQFSARVVAEFKTAYESGNDVLVNQILISRVRQGHEQLGWAVELWLRLNAGVPPLEVVKGALRALGTRGYSTAASACLQELMRRLGADTWSRLLRWYLFDSEPRLAAGAALELHRGGERRLYLLGSPILSALHDGGYVKEAEQVLDQLVHEGGAKAVLWLADRIAGAERDAAGAYSGWWRVFLDHLPVLNDRAPLILVGAARGVGCYLLPRHPEIRQRLRGLLEGPRGNEYRKALRETLNHHDPAQRHGAAMVLVASHSPADGDALLVAAKLRSRHVLGTWFEWEQFCLSLSFGPSTLAYVKSKLPDLDRRATTFVLAVMHRNGVRLDDQEFDALVVGLQETDNWGLDSAEPLVLASPRALPILERLVESTAASTAERAAQHLLKHHRRGLPEPLYARAMTARLRGAAWDVRDLEGGVEELETDALFATAVERAAADIVSRGGRPPLLDLIRAALGRPDEWRGVVWRMLCDASDIFHLDDRGQWLLHHGKMVPPHGRAIGEAALALLEDPRVQTSRWSEAIQWLTLLADEFVGVPSVQMEKALTGRQTTDRAVDSALIARLGHVPTGYRRRGLIGAVPDLPDLKQSPHVSAKQGRERLREVVLASDVTHPELCSVIEQLALAPPLASNDVEMIAAEGVHAALAASALSFVYGYPPKADFALRLLGRWYADDEANECFERLVTMFRVVHRELLTDSGETRQRYIGALSQALGSTHDGELLSIATELLRVRGKLAASEVEPIFHEYADFGKYHDRGLTGPLVIWLAEVQDQEMSVAVEKAVRNAVNALDNEPWDLRLSGPSMPLPFLVLPLAIWRLTHSADEVSRRVFLRGVKSLYAPESVSQTHVGLPPKRVDSIHTVIRKLEPLVSVVPRDLLEQAISEGTRCDDPVVRCLCVLLLTGFGARPNH